MEFRLRQLPSSLFRTHCEKFIAQLYPPPLTNSPWAPIPFKPSLGDSTGHVTCSYTPVQTRQLEFTRNLAGAQGGWRRDGHEWDEQANEHSIWKMLSRKWTGLFPAWYSLAYLPYLHCNFCRLYKEGFKQRPGKPPASLIQELSKFAGQFKVKNFVNAQRQNMFTMLMSPGWSLPSFFPSEPQRAAYLCTPQETEHCQNHTPEDKGRRHKLKWKFHFYDSEFWKTASHIALPSWDC